MRVLLLSAIRLESAEPDTCGWSEVFYHVMMDVIQAWGFAVFEERYGISKVLDGEKCQDGFMAVGFYYRIFVAYLAVFGQASR